MGGLDKAIERIAGEWAVVSGAPITFVLVVLAVCGVVAFVLHKWHEREKNALKAENTLKTLRIDGLKEETDRQARKIAELQNVPELSPAHRMGFTSAAAQQAVLKVIKTDTHSIEFYGMPLSWTPEELNQFALFTRAEELHAAKIDRLSPTVSTVTATVDAADFMEVLSAHQAKLEEDLKKK